MSADAPIAGKYRLLRRIGAGAMGEVWAALHVDMRREVALKLIHENSPELGARLTREGQALGRLEHPNIVRVYDIGTTDAGDPFLVMELLSGETLADRLARTPRLPAMDAVRVALEIACALRAAHEGAVVHRDLKPANVFLHRAGGVEQVKVLDFGVSKLLALDMAFTATGALIGSPAYMSPEAARALKEIDARADLWSLGVLLFEMVAGRRPFVSPTVVGIVAEILSAPIPRLAALVPGVDPRLDAVVARCLVRDVERRVGSADEVIDALAALSASPAAPAAPEAGDDEGAEGDPTTVFDPATLPRAPRVTDPDPDPDSERPTTLLKGAEAVRAKARAANRAQARPPAPAAGGPVSMPVSTAPASDSTVATRVGGPFPRAARVMPRVEDEHENDDDATIIKVADLPLNRPRAARDDSEDMPTKVQAGPWRRRDPTAQTVRLPESFTPEVTAPAPIARPRPSPVVITAPLPPPSSPAASAPPAALAQRERVRLIVLTSLAAFAITLVLVLMIAVLR